MQHDRELSGVLRRPGRTALQAEPTCIWHAACAHAISETAACDQVRCLHGLGGPIEGCGTLASSRQRQCLDDSEQVCDRKFCHEMLQKQSAFAAAAQCVCAATCQFASAATCSCFANGWTCMAAQCSHLHSHLRPQFSNAECFAFNRSPIMRDPQASATP